MLMDILTGGGLCLHPCGLYNSTVCQSQTVLRTSAIRSDSRAHSLSGPMSDSRLFETRLGFRRNENATADRK